MIQGVGEWWSIEKCLSYTTRIALKPFDLKSVEELTATYAMEIPGSSEMDRVLIYLHVLHLSNVEVLLQSPSCLRFGSSHASARCIFIVVGWFAKSIMFQAIWVSIWDFGTGSWVHSGMPSFGQQGCHCFLECLSLGQWAWGCVLKLCVPGPVRIMNFVDVSSTWHARLGDFIRKKNQQTCQTYKCCGYILY